MPTIGMQRRAVGLLAGLVAGALGAAAPAAAQDMNEIQVIGTHNSYHREISEVEQDAYDQLVGSPGNYDRSLAYSHATIGDQLEQQDVRGLELDLFPDPEGSLYDTPLLRQRLGLGELPDPAWDEPGIKVFHVADLDYNTTCVTFVTCLEQVRDFSRENPRHAPLLVMLELKGSNSRVVQAGGVQAPPWDGAALDGLDAEIRSVFAERDLVTPDDVRRRGRTLEESVLQSGWPSLRESRGKVAFLLDNGPGPIRDAYRAGAPSLEGRVVFTNSSPGQPDAAFLKRNDPRGANTAQIQDLVERGYLVRTRSDEPLRHVVEEDTSMRDAALESGAQLISTDFPQVGMSARYDSDYVARLPYGGEWRCNPVNAPPRCRDGQPRPPSVAFSVAPGSPAVYASPCASTTVEVTVRSTSRRDGYVDVVVGADGPLTVGRRVYGRWLEAGERWTFPVTVRSTGAPGQPRLTLAAGTSRERVPVRVSSAPPGDNLLLYRPVTASSSHPGYPACSTVDGNASSDDWGTLTGWNDNTPNVFPDTLEVRLERPRTVGRVDVQTLDSARYPAGTWGLLDWDVQLRAGGRWVTVDEVRDSTAGRVSSVFAPRTADAVRVVVLDARGGHARIIEVEAYEE